MLNRQQRRELDRQAAKTARDKAPTGFRGVVLHGGPQPAHIVSTDAPCLRPDWWRSYNAAVAHGWAKGPPIAPGRYVEDPDSVPRSATWRVDGTE